MNLPRALERGKQFVSRDVWGEELSGLSRVRRWLYRQLRTFSLAIHGFVSDRCILRGAALTLVFIFSLAPALAVGLAVAKGFGVFGAHDTRISQFIYEEMGLVDENGIEIEAGAHVKRIVDSVLEYVDKTSIEALGFIGLGLTLYASYRVLSAVETVLNDIWRVRQHRRVMRRVVDYLAVLFVFPILLMVTSFVAASLRSPTLVQDLSAVVPAFAVRSIGAAVGLVFSFCGFCFLYFFFPNTRVPIRSALFGALVAAIAWQAVQYGYLRAQVGVACYNAIYGTFAAIPIFVLWLHTSWLVILFGAELSFAHACQNELEFGGLGFRPSHAYREHVALGVMVLSARAFIQEKKAPVCEDMARSLAAPLQTVREIVASLCDSHLLVELRGNDGGYQPGMPPEQITVNRVLRSLHEQGDTSHATMLALERLGVREQFALRDSPAGQTTMSDLAHLGHEVRGT
jgi:membrane protein